MPSTEIDLLAIIGNKEIYHDVIRIWYYIIFCLVINKDIKPAYVTLLTQERFFTPFHGSYWMQELYLRSHFCQFSIGKYFPCFP